MKSNANIFKKNFYFDLLVYSSPTDIKEPNILLHTGYHLSGLASAAECEAIKENLDVDPYRRFARFFETDYKIYTDNTRGENERRRRNKPETLPLEKAEKCSKSFASTR